MTFAIADKKLAQRYRPQILADDQRVDYYFVTQDVVPENFTRIQFNSDEQSLQLGLKISPEDSSTVTEWEIGINKDVRLSALVSLIKSAHLTLFKMLGYRYALSSGGVFVGKDILGRFFLDNYDQPKSRVLENARHFFEEFVHMVRPVEVGASDLQGTIADGQMLICRGGGYFWALIVFIKTSSKLHAVMIPIFDKPDAVAKFLSFLENENDSIEVAPCFYGQGQWEIGKEMYRLTWPKKRLLYP